MVHVVLVHLCMHMLICRYKEMYSDKDSKEFLESQRYYERAALIQPHSGNAHNQVRFRIGFAHSLYK